MQLSSDQERARARVLQALAAGQRELVLAGPAGSGKTTLTRTLIDDMEGLGWEVRLMAPTGKAAVRLSELTGRRATTIHSPLYRHAVEDEDGSMHFSGARAVAGRDSVVLCDEASMMGRDLYADLVGKLPKSSRLLCVGDREQLPPVNDTWGANFDAPTGLLTEVHRQAKDSPIVGLATEIRLGRPWRSVTPSGAYTRTSGNLYKAAAWLADRRKAGVDATLLTYSNRMRTALNNAVRLARKHNTIVQPGDFLVCTKNHYGAGIFNGEVRQVAEVRGEVVLWKDPPSMESAQAWIKPDTLGAGGALEAWNKATAEVDDWDKAQLVRAEYGECLTVHKSQGSQWHSVCVVHDSAMDWLAQKDPETYRRLLYTAVTRAAVELVIMEV